MKNKIMVLGMAATLSACSTLDESLRLGALTGTLTGVAATYAGSSRTGTAPTNEEVALGASIGVGLGLIASYLIHEQVVNNRESDQRQTEIYFGDLPPSPFLIPDIQKKKGR